MLKNCEINVKKSAHLAIGIFALSSPSHLTTDLSDKYLLKVLSCFLANKSFQSLQKIKFSNFRSLWHAL